MQWLIRSLRRYIKKDASEYFEMDKLKALIMKHSEYGASPIFLWTETTTQVPVEDVAPDSDEVKVDEDEVKIEEEGEKKVEMKSVTQGAWIKVNDMAPLWMRYVTLTHLAETSNEDD